MRLLALHKAANSSTSGSMVTRLSGFLYLPFFINALSLVDCKVKSKFEIKIIIKSKRRLVRFRLVPFASVQMVARIKKLLKPLLQALLHGTGGGRV